MKKIYLASGFIVVAMILNFVGCTNSESSSDISITKSELSLNLVSPNNIRVAKNIRTLKETTALVICEKNQGIYKEFEITKVEYIPVEKGYAALIEYITEDGKINNYVQGTADPKSIFKGSYSIETVSAVKTRNEPGGGPTWWARCNEKTCSHCQIGGGSSLEFDEYRCYCSDGTQGSCYLSIIYY